METNEGGADAPKAGDGSTDVAKSAEASASTAAEKTTVLGASDPVAPPPAVETAKAGEASPAAETTAEVLAAKSTPPADPEAPAGAAAETDKAVEAAPQPLVPLAPVDQPPKPSNSGTIAGVVALLILLGGVLGTIFLARRNEATSGNKAAPRQHAKSEKKDTTPWNIGDKVPVVLTVLPEDTENLICAGKEEIKGKHCAYETKDKAWPKDDTKDDKILLRPYATTGKRRLIAAGFWSQIKEPVPTKRFSAKCTFVIEGKLDHPWVKFRKTMEFKEVKDSWYGGELADCAIIPEGGAAK